MKIIIEEILKLLKKLYRLIEYKSKYGSLWNKVSDLSTKKLKFISVTYFNGYTALKIRVKQD